MRVASLSACDTRTLYLRPVTTMRGPNLWASRTMLHCPHYAIASRVPLWLAVPNNQSRQDWTERRHGCSTMTSHTPDGRKAWRLVDTACLTITET